MIRTVWGRSTSWWKESMEKEDAEVVGKKTDLRTVALGIIITLDV